MRAGTRDAFTAISDPTRREVLELLRAREHAAGELVEAFPQLSQPGMSRHLRVLREAGLVNVRREEQRRVYSLRPEGLAQLDAWIARYRPFGELKVDALSKHLEAQAARKKNPSPKRKKR